MNMRALCAVAAAAIFTACGGGGGGTDGGGGGAVTATSSGASVIANGTGSVTITVTGGISFPVVLRASKGTLSGAPGTGTSLTFAAGPVTATLTPCDSRLSAACAGLAEVSVTDVANHTASVQVAFLAVEICDDGLDNNGNGLVDCADAACPAGTVCSAGGKTCAGTTCSACSGKGGASEPAAEVSCGDGFDNDCDGLVDCADPDCAGDVCNSAPSTGGGFTTGTCNGTTKACVCTPVSETAAKCADGLDNDCDGLIDGEDANCVGMPCDAKGMLWSQPTPVSTCSVCSGNGGTAQVQETDCADGKDNDCDGLADCADPDCAASTYACTNATYPAAPGWVCSAVQRTCSTCTGNGGVSESAEASCGDGFDNDCDGVTDCADINCRNQACNASGMKCTNNASGNTCTVCTAVPAEQPKELTCGDGVDNDCDGRLDCADVDCQPSGGTPGKACGLNGRLCSAAGGGSCVCSGNGGVAEATEASCGDGKDNDCDGLVDCADPDCQPVGGGAGASCGTFGKVCTAAGACACSGNGGAAQATEASCSDGFDNDCDGTVDCADTNCANQACTLSLGGGLSTAGTCNATSKACTCTPVAETGALCGDGKDNDCDGFVDCADTSCQPVGNALGQPCDANGNRCSPVAGGVSACNVCAPGGDPINAQSPGAETKCGDNLDNDCDGKADCQDANCATNALTCDNTGKACTAALLCRCPDASGTETVCDDGLDNDCDGKVDCQDTQCQPSGGIPGRTCGANGKICSATGGGTCVCSGNGGVAQATETSCTDGFDNDCDGLADCADPDCRPAAGSTFGAACTTATLVANAKCDASGQCVCTGGQASENTCSDGADNDCDGYPDCLDLNCNGKTCGVNGRLCATSANGTGSCVCPATPGSDGTTEVCNDGIDNNCDGKVDCADTACQATLAQCNPANSAYKCTNVGTGTPNWVCKDTSAFVLTVTPASNRVAANGIATTALTVKLLDTTSGTAAPKAGATVTLSTTLGTVTPSVVTDAGGLNSLGVFTGSVTAGAATITATYAGTATVTATTTVNLPALSAISLAAQDFQVMGARDSGYQELNELTFLLTDANGQSYPAGLQVDFEHTPTGGSFIEVTGQAQSCTPSLCTTHGFTDASGKVRVLLHSGSVAGTVAVTAKASAGGTGLKQVTAGNIAIVGAKANGNEFTITCSPQNVPALISQDCTNSSYFGADATVSCRVVINDRYKNKLGVPALVQFFSEAGAMGSSATTPAYDPSKTPGQQTALGTATGIYVASGAKLPEDVAPQPGEYAYPHNWDGCAVAGTRVHNPRDGLVTVIATAQGEEGFFDGSNSCPANGLYDPPGSAGCALGERFVDLPEPFVDINDNGVRDAIAAGGEFDEPYFDANNNGQWDGPNGARDASTTIWAETRILYTGYAEVRFEGAEAGSRVYNAFPSPFTPTPTADASFVVFHSTSTPPPARAATSQSVGVYVTDLNFNLPNYKSSYTLSKSGGIKADVISLPTSADGLGMLFRQLYCDGTNPAADCLATCSYNQCVRKADVGSFQYGSFGAFTVTGGTAPESACAWITASLKTTNTISGISTDRLIDIPVCGVALTPP